MSLEAADDSEYEMPPVVRAAIDVKIGNINVTAILDDTCVINAIHKKVFKRICSLIDEAVETYDKVENIELDFTIDGRSVTAVFRILENLYCDMTLGDEFFQTVKAHINRKLRLLNWSYQDELVITNMVENEANFRALSGGSDAFNEVQLLEMEVETGEPSVESDDKKKRKRKDSDSESDAYNDGSSTSSDSDATSVSGDLDLPTLSSGIGKAMTKDVKNDEFAQIFIADNTSSGKCSAFYVIYFFEKKIVYFANEVLEPEKKTPLGYYMEAFRNAFCGAEKHGIKHLHLISENKEAVELMTAQLENFKKYGQVQPDQFPDDVNLYRLKDFANYFNACCGITRFESLKFEFVPSDDERYEGMVHARQFVECFSFLY
ncbi:uncharacterized protein LOC135831644 [Planococcus citri]|uniref:uncharacterized protein LOC135831644 n=1 Tax=Planococcus citri TaxID=170843 RepID=UPI0031FA19D9